jgi:hypothetical protein
MLKNKTILLLLRNIIEKVKQIKPKPRGRQGIVYNATATLNSLVSLYPFVRLLYSGESNNNISLSLNSTGSRKLSGNSILSNGLDLATIGNRSFVGSSTLNNYFSLLSSPLLNISGNNTGSVILLLNSEGDLAGQQFGDSMLSTVTNLLAAGSLDIVERSSLSQIFSVTGNGHRDILGRTDLNNSITFNSRPSLYIGGQLNPSIIFELSHGDMAFDASNLLISHILSANGSVNYAGRVNLNHIYTILSNGTLDNETVLDIYNHIHYFTLRHSLTTFQLDHLDIYKIIL